MNKILLVDDEKNILDAYKRNLSDMFDVTTADSGAAALELFGTSPGYQVIVTDYKMPKMNGVELLEKVRGISPDTVQVMLTGQADMQAIIDLINKGKIFRFLTKPCSHEDMIKNINDAVRQYELISAERELLGKTLGGSIKVLTDLLALSKPQAFNKMQSIRGLAKKIYRSVEMENKWQVELGAMLSQIGCVTIPDDVLKKVYRGLTLSEDENIMFQNHSQIGADMIKNIPRMDKVAEIIRYQEKNYDGSGFPPDDISGNSIPEGSRILKIAIDYDRMITGGAEEEASLLEMKKKSGVYDQLYLEIAVKNFLSRDGSGRSFINSELSPDELKEGMYLADDLVSAGGTIIGSKNQKISSALLAAIRNYSRNNQLSQKIRVVTVAG